VAGPLIGGYLTENFSWHWIFYVNIPIGIIALIVIQRLLPTVKNPAATRTFDILGGVIFTIAISLLLIGLTNKQFGEWTDLSVGGLILAGIIGSVLFVLAEARAKEPIVPLNLWRSRTYSASMVSTFFAAFAFFGAVVFLPRWLQFVQGFTPTNSGLGMLPLVGGLIFSSIISGLIVSKTGRYKWLLVFSIALIGVGTLLMTQLTKDTSMPVLWIWMLIAGLGVGPTFSVFTIVIQNAVPFRQLGVGTSNLTFFRQIGGSVALAFVGTIFAQTLKDDLPSQLKAAGVPDQVLAGFQQATTSGSFDFNSLLNVGGSLGAAIMAQIPAQAQQFVAPYIDNIVNGIYAAFSLAVAQSFWLGVFGSIVAVAAAIFIKEIPLRASNSVPAYTEQMGTPGVPATVTAATVAKSDSHKPDTHSPKPATD
jgi:MFS family permease